MAGGAYIHVAENAGINLFTYAVTIPLGCIQFTQDLFGTLMCLGVIELRDRFELM